MHRRTVGSFEAKTQLPRLRRQVSWGNEIVITKNGKPAAGVPPERPSEPFRKEIIQAMKQLRRAQTIGPNLTVRDLIEDGRRY